MSFKVICTNHDRHRDERMQRIPIGTIVTADGKEINPTTGELCYHIVEYPTSGGYLCYYWSGNFSTISGISNEEIEEEYQEQEAADLDRELAKIVHEYENA